jgi:hypothetical protein
MQALHQKTIWRKYLRAFRLDNIEVFYGMSGIPHIRSTKRMVVRKVPFPGRDSVALLSTDRDPMYLIVVEVFRFCCFAVNHVLLSSVYRPSCSQYR